MNNKCRFGIYTLLLCVCLNFVGCSSESAVDENESIVQAEEENDLYNLIVDKATELAEPHTFEEGDIYVDSIRYGYYSQSEEQELLALCKFKDSQHVAGLDRTLAIIFSQESMEVIAYKEFGADEVTLQCLPTEGASKILFLGRSSSIGLTTQYTELYIIQDNEWVEIPLEGINLQGDELCYITDDNSLVVVPRENGAYPTQMFVLWDEQAVYSWDELTERFINKQISEETAEKIIWGDLDGNGIQEYFILSGDGGGTLALYFNNELIYQYEDNIVGIDRKEYLDLDHDGELEIFVSFLPNVNSMPLVEWFALKKGESGWELMEMYHENDDMAQNAFPISVNLKEKDFVLSITCEGCDKEIVYDATNHYEQKKEEEKEWNDSSYNTFMGMNFEIGDEVGSTSAWGIWNIESGTYEDKNCLIAEHGLQGPNGKYDFYGYLDVYFDFDENAKIRILNIDFREKVEEPSETSQASEIGEHKTDMVMAEEVIDFGEYKDDSIKLIMTDGRYYTEEETAPAVGVYDENYEGQYVLQIVDSNGKVVDKLSLNEDWGMEKINFAGEFELCVSDYNKDGFPDFTIGTAASSGMNDFRLYSITKEGKIAQLTEADGFVDVNKNFSFYLEQEEGSTDFFTTTWNNATGEAETEYWEWKEQDEKYVQVEIDDMSRDVADITVSEEEPHRLAFGKVLWDAYQRGILPDGSELEYRGMEAAANNTFAISDVDCDGQEELLLYWDYAAMAGMVGVVFGYNDGAIHVEMREFPRLIFYENGMVEAAWSHNQTYADFWPYDVFLYNTEKDVYQSYGGVEAWDKSRREENYIGDSFPTDIDADGDGIVYYILPANWDGQYDDIPLVDGADYENWRNAYLDGTEEINISFHKLTEENIAALGYPKPDIVLPQPLG